MGAWETAGPAGTASVTPAYRTRRVAPRVARRRHVPLRAGEDGRAEAWREAAAARFPADARGTVKTLYLGRMPEAGKVTLEAQLASKSHYLRQLRPTKGVAIADAAGRQSWTFRVETLSPETEVIDIWHACEHLRCGKRPRARWPPFWFERYRKVLRQDPCGVDIVIRVAPPSVIAQSRSRAAEIDRELACLPQAPPGNALPRA